MAVRLNAFRRPLFEQMEKKSIFMVIFYRFWFLVREILFWSNNRNFGQIIEIFVKNRNVGQKIKIVVKYLKFSSKNRNVGQKIKIIVKNRNVGQIIKIWSNNRNFGQKIEILDQNIRNSNLHNSILNFRQIKNIFRSFLF